MDQPTLYLMFGYPGAGKTTTGKAIQRLVGAAHLSSDAIRLELFPKPTYSQAEHDTVYATLDKRAEKLLINGQSVVYDGNLNRFIHRAEKYALCERVGARPLLIWMQTPKSVARDRAVMRGHYHLIPQDETFESMFQRVSNTLERPHPGEPVRRIHGTNLSENALRQAIKA